MAWMALVVPVRVPGEQVQAAPVGVPVRAQVPEPAQVLEQEQVQAAPVGVPVRAQVLEQVPAQE